MPQNKPTLEVCIDDAVGLSACQGRADRIELCSALGVGGLTPSFGLMRLARSSTVPIHTMIRPRVGGFEYTNDEVAVMLNDIQATRETGLAGIVIGATHGDRLDIAALRQMRDAAGGLECTLHRAIDLLPDPVQAMEDVIALGFTRILTSGGAPKAADGTATLAALHAASRGRIDIMAGSGVTKDNVADIARATGLRAFHASCSAPAIADANATAFGFSPTDHRQTNPAEIDALRRATADIA